MQKTTETIRINIADAQRGDEMLQAGEWVEIDSVHVFGDRRDMVKVMWVGGGSMTLPLSHSPATRRPVAEPVTHRHALVLCEAGREGLRVIGVGEVPTCPRCREAWLYSNCPGFDLWRVTFDDGTSRTVASDNHSHAEWYSELDPATGSRVRRAVLVEHVGANPAAIEWKTARGTL